MFYWKFPGCFFTLTSHRAHSSRNVCMFISLSFPSSAILSSTNIYDCIAWLHFTSLCHGKEAVPSSMSIFYWYLIYILYLLILQTQHPFLSKELHSYERRRFDLNLLHTILSREKRETFKENVIRTKRIRFELIFYHHQLTLNMLHRMCAFDTVVTFSST